MGTTVRRNLFQHHLSRRPVLPPTSNILSQESNSDAHRLRTEKSAPPGSTLSVRTSLSTDSSDIVAKNQNGGYEFDIPALVQTPGTDNGGEMHDIDETGSGTGAVRMTSVIDSTGIIEAEEREKERIEARLMEMVGRGRNKRLSYEPAEILNIIQQSLQNKVASLEDDRWMYEPGNESLP